MGKTKVKSTLFGNFQTENICDMNMKLMYLRAAEATENWVGNTMSGAQNLP